MKIIVQNSREKKLIEDFKVQLEDSNILLTYFNGIFEENEKYYLQDTIDYNESMYIESALINCEVIVDENVEEMMQEHDIINGVCKECGKSMEGTIDGDPISYYEFVDWQSWLTSDKALCFDCMKIVNREG